MAVVSPHLDDAVFSCGRLLSSRPGSHVVTVFSHGPRHRRRLTTWDRMSGFSPGDDVMGLRQAEDDAALALLKASPHRLGFREPQYARLRWPRRFRRGPLARMHLEASGRMADSVADRLLPLVERLGVSIWVVPLGLVHHDHVLTARACRIAATRAPHVQWVAYEELPYRAEAPDQAAAALQALAASGWGVETLQDDDHDDAAPKRRAAACYRSQCAALGVRADLAVSGAEVYHRLVPPVSTTSP